MRATATGFPVQTGSCRIWKTECSAIAQSVEQMTVNHWVPGSSPGRGAKFESLGQYWGFFMPARNSTGQVARHRSLCRVDVVFYIHHEPARWIATRWIDEARSTLRFYKGSLRQHKARHMAGLLSIAERRGLKRSPGPACVRWMSFFTSTMTPLGRSPPGGSPTGGPMKRAPPYVSTRGPLATIKTGT